MKEKILKYSLYLAMLFVFVAIGFGMSEMLIQSIMCSGMALIMAGLYWVFSNKELE